MQLIFLFVVVVYILYLLVVYSVILSLGLVLVSHDLRVLAHVLTVYMCHLYTCHFRCFVPITLNIVTSDLISLIEATHTRKDGETMNTNMTCRQT